MTSHGGQMRSDFYFTFFIKIYFYINIFLVKGFITKCTQQKFNDNLNDSITKNEKLQR
jgi:hypothetical protein